MAGKPKKTKTIDKWRKKRYFPLLAPKVFQERELGKSIAYESDSLVGRSVAVNLMSLTGNIKKQNIVITFKVDKVRGDTGYTRVDKYEVVPSAVKRKVRRQRDRLDESFQCVTKDNKIVRIKPLVVTSVRTSSLVKTSLRKHLIQQMMNAIRKIDYDSFVMELVNDRFQKDIKNKINRVVPIRSVDVRIMKLVGKQDSVGAAEDAAPEAKEDTAPEVGVEPETAENSTA
ncbi:hypothetical protein KY362_02130 [Candidatus Woesearchaeota archaeon]|nr:hypothetical protein [Candidatus Woesearchaeota archaeon]